MTTNNTEMPAVRRYCRYCGEYVIYARGYWEAEGLTGKAELRECDRSPDGRHAIDVTSLLDLPDIAARIPGAALKENAVSVPLGDGVHTVDLDRKGRIWLYDWSDGTVMSPPRHAAMLTEISPGLAAWAAARDLEEAVGAVTVRFSKSPVPAQAGATVCPCRTWLWQRQ